MNKFIQFLKNTFKVIHGVVNHLIYWFWLITLFIALWKPDILITPNYVWWLMFFIIDMWAATVLFKKDVNNS